MKKMKRFLLLLMLFSASVTLVAQTKTEDKIQSYLNQYRSDFIKNSLDKNSDRLAIYYGEETRLMPPFQKTIITKGNVLFYYRAFAMRFDITAYDRTPLDVLDMGAMVAEVGHFNTKMKLKSSGKEYQLKGKYLDLWQKQKDGSLLLLAAAWNYDHPIDFADQLRFSEVPDFDVALSSHVPVDNPVRFELAALNRLMEATVSQHDAHLWSQFYADDALLCHGGRIISKGRKEIDVFTVEHCKELPIFEKLDIRNDRIDDLGVYIIEYASHIATVRNGGWSGVGLGKDLRIWKREKNGSLKIYRHIDAYD